MGSPVQKTAARRLSILKKRDVNERADALLLSVRENVSDIEPARVWSLLEALGETTRGRSCAIIHRVLGELAHHRDDHPTAMQHLTTARLAVPPDSLELIAEILYLIGITHLRIGDAEEALGLAYEVLRQLQVQPAFYQRMLAHHLLGEVHGAGGRWDAALQSHRTSGHFAARAGSQRGRFLAQYHEAHCLYRLDLFEEAHWAARAAHALLSGLPARFQALSLGQLGILHLSLEQLDVADKHLVEWARVTEGTAPLEYVRALLHLGRLRQRQNNLDGALEIFEHALHEAEPLDSAQTTGEIERALSVVHEARGDYQAALRHFQRFHAAERTCLGEKSDLRYRTLEVRHQIDRVEADRQIYRLQNVELERANVELRALRDELQRKNQEDPLTGLANRRALDQGMRAATRYADRTGTVFAVLVADIDHFKRVNDNYSHAAGDAALIQVAKILRNGSRDRDIVARFGGEEFVILLQETGLAQAVEIAERLRAAIEAEDWSVIHDDVDQKIIVTTSIGVAIWRPGLHAETLLSEADRYLYEAKANGRNLVCYPDWRDALVTHRRDAKRPDPSA